MAIERPNFAGVLAEHYPLTDYDGQIDECGCGQQIGAMRADDRADYADHLSDVVQVEVDRWLADEGTVHRMAEGLRLMAGTGARTYGFPEIAATALATLTTTTEPTAEEQR